MTTRSLQIFVKVADCGKMSEAAREMFITQSSVSQAISDIEREFNIRLFERLGKRLYLTPLGKELLTYARHMLTFQDTMTDWLKQSAEVKRLRVGATVSVGSSVLSPIISALSNDFPQVKSEIFVANTHILEEMLLQSDLDIALVEGDVSRQDLIAKDAMNDRLVLICGKKHPFWGRKNVDAFELENCSLILREEGSGTRAQVEDQLKKADIKYNISWVCYDTEAIKRAVEDGHGVSVISTRLIERECENGYLWSCPVSGVNFDRTFKLLHHKNKFFTDVLTGFVNVTLNYGKNELSQKH